MGLKSKSKVDPSVIRALFGDSLIALYPFDGDGLDYSGNGRDMNITAGTFEDGRLLPGLGDQHIYFDGSAVQYIPDEVRNLLYDAFEADQGALLCCAQVTTRQDTTIAGVYEGAGDILFNVRMNTATFVSNGINTFSTAFRDDDGAPNRDVAVDNVAGSESGFYGFSIGSFVGPDINLITPKGLKTPDRTTGDNPADTWVSNGQPFGIGGQSNVNGDKPEEVRMSYLMFLDRAVTKREIEILNHLAKGADATQPDYVSAYPTAKTIELGPDFYISSAGEPDQPSINSVDETPTNQAAMFGATSVSATQPTVSNRPIWLGKWNGWELAGDDYWVGNTNAVPDGDWTFVTVGTITNGDTTSFPYMWSQYSSGSENGRMGLSSTSTPEYRFFIGDGDGASDIIIDGGDPTVLSVVVVRRSGETIELFYNGASQGSQTLTGLTNSTSETVFGSRLKSGANFMEGELAESQSYSKALTNAEVADLADELAAKWGIS